MKYYLEYSIVLLAIAVVALSLGIYLLGRRVDRLEECVTAIEALQDEGEK